MATTNEQLFDLYISRQISLIAYANNLSNQSLKLLKNSDEAVQKELLFYADKLSNQTRNTAAYNKTKEQLTTAIAKIRAPIYKTLRSTLPDEILELGVAETVFAATVINKALPLATPLDFKFPTKADLKTGIDNAVLPEGRNFQQWLLALEEADATRMTGQITTALNNGSTPSQAVTSVRNQGIKKAQASLSTLISTMTTATATESRNQLYNNNKNFISQEIYRATLDSKTTPICSITDGKVFDLGQGSFPPLHYNCRSVRIPFIDSQSYWERSFDPTIEKTILNQYAKQNNLGSISSRDSLPYGTKGKFDSFARQERASRIGKLPDKTTYSEFLQRQSTEFQNEVLGTRRAQIFRQTGEPLERFVNRDGMYLTLDQLKAKFA